jgi:hypothetical protein
MPTTTFSTPNADCRRGGSELCPLLSSSVRTEIFDSAVWWAEGSEGYLAPIVICLTGSFQEASFYFIVRGRTPAANPTSRLRFRLAVADPAASVAIGSRKRRQAAHGPARGSRDRPASCRRSPGAAPPTGRLNRGATDQARVHTWPRYRRGAATGASDGGSLTFACHFKFGEINPASGGPTAHQASAAESRGCGSDGTRWAGLASDRLPLR